MGQPVPKKTRIGLIVAAVVTVAVATVLLAVLLTQLPGNNEGEIGKRHLIRKYILSLMALF